jgi:dTDP-4-dehydrorhamnose reductase
MRTLILGGTGMLGHKLWQLWNSRPDVWVTVKRPTGTHPLFDGERVVPDVDASAFGTLADTVSRLQPEVVVDCIGIVKQAAAANDAVTAIEINALFPQRLAVLCRSIGARLIHISTDCVFSGRVGAYTEASLPDADDLYGRSKLLGEVGGNGCLTLRTSMIGREITRPTHGLVEWFLAQRGGGVAGYRHAVFSGFTTAALAHVIDTVIREHRRLEGVYHVAAEPISKFDLLTMLNAAFTARVTIDPVDEPHIDRSLDGARFRAATGVIAPSWPEMVQQLAVDATPYDEWTKL